MDYARRSLQWEFSGSNETKEYSCSRPVGMFLTEIDVPFCQTIFIPVSVFRGHFSLNGNVQIMINAFHPAKIVLGYVYYLPIPFYDRFTQAHKL